MLPEKNSGYYKLVKNLNGMKILQKNFVVKNFPEKFLRLENAPGKILVSQSLPEEFFRAEIIPKKIFAAQTLQE